MHSITFLLMIFLVSSCSEDTKLENDPFVIAFESLSKNLINIKDKDTISLVYSDIAYETGTVIIEIDDINAIYGIDYTTKPEASNHIITLSINAGENTNTIIFNKLNPLIDETTSIALDIKSINHSNSSIQGNSSFLLNASASLGSSIKPNVGGPNQGYQVFIDLSSESSTAIQRDSWDLGFYSGDNFRVTINSSIYMATAQLLGFTDIDTVTQNDVSGLQGQVAVGTFNPENTAYIDAPNGNILETAINEVSEIEEENKVYLVNLGYEIGTDTPTIGSAAITGPHRGWKKIRILKKEDKYLLQYADIDDTTHQEITISKNSNYNFSFFSFNTNTVVSVEPEKEQWDISLTVFTNIIEGAGSYGYSDFVTHNSKGATLAYMLKTSTTNYTEFALSNVDYNLFSDNQTIIGANWRDVFSGTPYNDRFFIIQDPNENIYKLNFLALTNSNGERGYPEFEYELLQ